MEKVILHCDLNNFYASGECMKKPELYHQYMVVGGSEANRHGIVLAKNEMAKQKGVKTGEPIWQAKNKCGTLVVVPPNFHEYLYLSKLIKDIYKEYSDRIESFGIDEAWIDVSESTSLFGSGENIAIELRQRIKDTYGLTISVGVSFNKIYAKLGSDYKKPDAVTVFSKENYREKVFPLPVEEMLYVGRATKEKLNAMHIYTIGQLATYDRSLLRERFGKMGEVLHDFANGNDRSEVALFDRKEKVKSIGNGITTKRDLVCLEDAKLVLVVLCEAIATRLRKEKLVGRCVSVHFRNAQLISFSRQYMLDEPTSLATLILEKALWLCDKHYNFDIGMRSMSVQVSQLSNESSFHQLALFSNTDTLECLERCMDAIRQKYGMQSIMRACVLKDQELTGFSPLENHLIFPQGYFK